MIARTWDTPITLLRREREALQHAVALGATVAAAWCKCGEHWVNGCAVVAPAAVHTRRECRVAK